MNAALLWNFCSLKYWKSDLRPKYAYMVQTDTLENKIEIFFYSFNGEFGVWYTKIQKLLI